MPGAFKLDHLHPFKPLLFLKFSTCFTFILGGQFLLPQRANNEKREFPQLKNWMKCRSVVAWGIHSVISVLMCYTINTYLTSHATGTSCIHFMTAQFHIGRHRPSRSQDDLPETFITIHPKWHSDQIFQWQCQGCQDRHHRDGRGR